MKKVLMLAWAGLFFSANSWADDSSCEVKIDVSIPGVVETNNLIVRIKQQQLSINKNNPQVCVSRKSLGVYPRKFSSGSVELLATINQKNVLIYEAKTFNQSTQIRIDAASTIVSDICSYDCGYYEYQQLKKNSAIIEAGIQYNETILKDFHSILDFPSRRKKFSQIKARYAKALESYWPDAGYLETMPKHARDYGIDGYSGAYRYWSKYHNLNNIFRDKVLEGKKKVLKGTRGADYEEEFKPYGKELIAVFRKSDDWKITRKTILSIGGRMIENTNSLVKKYGEMLHRVVDEVDSSLRNYLEAKGQKFNGLSDKAMNKERVVANWYRYAYNYAENSEAFAALFSQKLRNQLYTQIAHDRELDKSLSKMIGLYDRMSLGNSDEKAFRHLLNEYRYATKLKNEKILVEDALEKLVWKYEEGQWRLDSFEVLDF